MTEEKHFRKILSFVKRNGRMRPGQKRAIENLWPVYGIEYKPELLDLNLVFGRDAKKNLEIGFGMAENLISVSQSKPDEDFIGIEVYEPGLGHALLQIEEFGIKNTRVMKHDAVDVLSHQIADSSLDSISIFFPDPWHKKKHNKRRLINDEFSQLMAKKIKPGGIAYMATDWEDYAEQMLKVFSNNSAFENTSPCGDYCERMDFRPITKFEKRGKRLGHGVWDLIFQKI